MRTIEISGLEFTLDSNEGIEIYKDSGSSYKDDTYIYISLEDLKEVVRKLEEK